MEPFSNPILPKRIQLTNNIVSDTPNFTLYQYGYTGRQLPSANTPGHQIQHTKGRYYRYSNYLSTKAVLLDTATRGDLCSQMYCVQSLCYMQSLQSRHLIYHNTPIWKYSSKSEYCDIILRVQVTCRVIQCTDIFQLRNISHTMPSPCRQP